MFDDEKIKLIEQMPDADTILMIWIKLLVQAGKVNASGNIFLNENIPYTDEMLATIFDRPISTVRLALETFKQFGMISIDENLTIRIKNWEKHQSTDKMARLKEQTRIRQQKYYYRNKLRELGINVDEKGFTDDLEELKNILEQLEKPNVRLTLPNETEVRSKKLDVRSKNKEYIYSLFDYWNEKEIIKHRKRTQAMESHINARLQEYSVDELKRAIDNYSLVLRSDDYYWTHKWTLQDFMKPSNVIRFVDDADPLNNFKSNKKEKTNKKGGIDLSDFNLDD